MLIQQTCSTCGGAGEIIKVRSICFYTGCMFRGTMLNDVLEQAFIRSHADELNSQPGALTALSLHGQCPVMFSGLLHAFAVHDWFQGSALHARAHFVVCTCSQYHCAFHTLARPALSCRAPAGRAGGRAL